MTDLVHISDNNKTLCGLTPSIDWDNYRNPHASITTTRVYWPDRAKPTLKIKDKITCQNCLFIMKLQYPDLETP